MKVFNLRCNFGHDFEGWFASTEDFETQRRDRVLCCPLCESVQVERLPSAPRLNFGAQEERSASVVASATASATAAAAPTAPVQAAWMQAVREITEHVLSNTENVGERFAEEARRIHYRETPERAIRGVATPQEHQELQEEGITVLALPPLPRFKGTLQ